MTFMTAKRREFLDALERKINEAAREYFEAPLGSAAIATINQETEEILTLLLEDMRKVLVGSVFKLQEDSPRLPAGSRLRILAVDRDDCRFQVTAEKIPAQAGQRCYVSDLWRFMDATQMVVHEPD
jgi:hypothetical protein